MIRILFGVLLLLPMMGSAQSTQNDPFEKIQLPEREADLPSILNLWKQFNSVKMEYLMKFDSILFYKNDSLSFTYYIANLKFFQKNMAISDSVLKALTDSVYNKKLNSYDSYFTDLEKNRSLDTRKYIDKNGRYFKAEQFSEGVVSVKTAWLFDKEDNILSEINEFVFDSSTYRMVYKREKSIILQRHAIIKSKRLECEYITDYNRRGGIVAYSYIDLKGVRKVIVSIKVGRDQNNRTEKIDGLLNNKPIRFVFNYSENRVQIVRNYNNRTTTFKLVMY